ncbi:dihydrofolate reductase family protein [Dactylosporangium matsuzakiense]|uniref:Deaminase n=1 Tax=Dactylosporangium matsuzakiense TaxID=53360 RepID=A0A9W6NMB3_9ACTN|nr:dihydrofolate reductase family protein [Dactylosporangium matsuzakiense]GLL02845.1 deaminase [Dactylosporangium matsuzakiense]
MRRLILQMQMSVDGFVSAHAADAPWQVWNWGPDWTWDARLRQDFNATFQAIDTILLSRKMAEEGYLDHWARTAEQHRDDPDWAFAARIGEVRKVVATSRPIEPRWPRTTVRRGALPDTVHALKREDGRDIICFGGAGFAGALIAEHLVDELQLYVNPAAVGAGEAIFAGHYPLTHLDSRAYDCGVVIHRYAMRQV